ncbi:type III toxin-antitoxin system ToxN/AbiQ family toxin [Enterococcus faecium]|nr:type III toxin-antitoxin system ToxN/AbiQ family toxin [Enterococcus faecium]
MADLDFYEIDPKYLKYLKKFDSSVPDYWFCCKVLNKE